MSDYQCPKCGGSNYYYAKRNVSGAIFVVLRTKKVPICKDCDEIMESALKLNPIIPLIGKVVVIALFVYFVVLLLITGL